MGLRKYILKYKDYETKELAKRAAKKKKIETYKNLVIEAKRKELLRKKELERLRAIKKKKILAKRIVKQQPIFKKRKFDVKKFNKAIGDPYRTRY